MGIQWHPVGKRQVHNNHVHGVLQDCGHGVQVRNQILDFVQGSMAGHREE
jgi:hypothetical protein